MSAKPVKLKGRFKHGWNPDPLDKRDLIYAASPRFLQELRQPTQLPAHFDLRESAHNPPIADQGNLGSCTAFGAVRCFDFIHHLLFSKFFGPSHLFQYYVTRQLEGTVGEDSGATIRDAVKALAQFGCYPEAKLKYVPACFKQKPTPAQYKTATRHQALKYYRVENDAQKGGQGKIKSCIFAGYPIVFGSSLYTSFESPGPDDKGCIPWPDIHRESLLGGHCQVIVGWSDLVTREGWPEPGAFLVANSWGDEWAQAGYEWMPYSYLTDPDLATDFWTLRTEEK